MPVKYFYSFLERRYSKRQLTKLAVGLLITLLGTQAFMFWYFGTTARSLSGMAHDRDNRTLLLSYTDRQEFIEHYSNDLEEGWCVYGYGNQTHIVVQDVEHISQPRSQSSGKILYTCVPQTVNQMLQGKPWMLIGDVHSHPDRSDAMLSKGDTMSWATTSALLDLKGVYTVADGPEFFTTSSLSTPLEKQLVEE